MSDQEFEAWARSVTRGVTESDVFVQLFSPKFVDDPLSEPQAVMQLGLAVLLDKPIIVMRFDGDSLPPMLSRLAARVCQAKRDDPESAADALREALTGLRAEREGT